MEKIVESNSDIISQKDALTHYLRSLLKEESVNIDKNADTKINQETTGTQNCLPSVEENVDLVGRMETSFACLPILVFGMNLYVPLKRVRTVISMTGTIDTSDNGPNWIKGSIQRSHKVVYLIDMQKVIFQDKKKSPLSVDDAKIVLINDGSWGILCDDVGMVQSVNRDDIQWRGDNAKRAWIAGTSIKHKMTILDINYFERNFSISRGE